MRAKDGPKQLDRMSVTMSHAVEYLLTVVLFEFHNRMQ